MLTQSDLSLILMFQFIFVGVVDLLVYDFLYVLFWVFVLGIHLPVVVFYHHDTALFVVPSYLRFLTDDLVVLVTHEEGFG